MRHPSPFCSWVWALVNKGRLAFNSVFCLTTVKLPFSKATFKKKKDDIYKSLLSGDLGGRERGRVYRPWKQAKKIKTQREGNAVKPQSFWNNHGRDGCRFEDRRCVLIGTSSCLPPPYQHIFTYSPSLSSPRRRPKVLHSNNNRWVGLRL